MESKQNKDLLQILDFSYCLLIWLILIFIFLPLLLTIFIPLYFWKLYIVPALAKIFAPSLVKLLDGYDGILAVDPFWSNPYSTLIGFITLEGSLDTDKFREKVLKIIRETKCKDGKLVFQKMTQYPVPFLGYYFWKNVQDLSQLSAHFHIISEPTSEAELKESSAKLIRAPFRSFGPLWDITIYTNYEGSKTALQIRINHIIGDGMTCLKFFHKLCDYEQPPLVLKNDYKRQSLREKALIFFRAPAIILHLYLDNLTNSDIFNRKKVENEYLVSWSTFPSDSIKLIRSKTNVHFSAIGLSLFGGFLTRHFNSIGNNNNNHNHTHNEKSNRKTHHNQSHHNNHNNNNNKDHVKIMLPLPWPNHPNDKMVNHWTASFMKVPISTQISAYERLLQTNKDFWSVLYSGSPQFCRPQPPLLCFLPYPILKLIVTSNFGMGLCFTSIPGMYTEDLNLMGHRVVSVISQCGPQFPQTGILASLFTYRGKVGFCITANKQLIPTQESLDQLLTKFLQMELDEIVKHIDTTSLLNKNEVIHNYSNNHNNNHCNNNNNNNISHNDDLIMKKKL